MTAGQTWTGTVTSLANAAGALTNTRHPAASDAQAMTKYRTAAWLTTQFSSTNMNEWSSIQHAIWNVFTPARYAATAWDLQAASAAAGNFAGLNFANFSVLTDVTAAGQAIGGAQEFIVPGGINGGITADVVPEPATYLLLGSGLVAIGGWRAAAGSADPRTIAIARCGARSISERAPRCVPGHRRPRPAVRTPHRGAPPRHGPHASSVHHASMITA